jgi:hypothetical protein
MGLKPKCMSLRFTNLTEEQALRRQRAPGRLSTRRWQAGGANQAMTALNRPASNLLQQKLFNFLFMSEEV